MKKKKKPQRNGCSFRDLARGADTIAETTWLEDQLPPRKVHVGSDCAGLLTEGSLSRSNSVFLIRLQFVFLYLVLSETRPRSAGLALEMLGIPHQHVFASEMSRHVRHLLYQRHGRTAMRFYKDLTTRDNQRTPTCHLYVFGFPCQPFSSVGLGKGSRVVHVV